MTHIRIDHEEILHCWGVLSKNLFILACISSSVHFRLKTYYLFSSLQVKRCYTSRFSPHDASLRNRRDVSIRSNFRDACSCVWWFHPVMILDIANIKTMKVQVFLFTRACLHDRVTSYFQIFSCNYNLDLFWHNYQLVFYDPNFVYEQKFVVILRWLIPGRRKR